MGDTSDAHVLRRTFRLDLAYDGSRFFGFSQQSNRPTVEGALLDRLKQRFPKLPGVSVAGRTDRGVHAHRQVVSFYTRELVTAEQLHELFTRSPLDGITLWAVTEVPRRFHASFSATARHYQYWIAADPKGMQPADLEEVAARLNPYLKPLLGTRCLRAFARRPGPGSTVRSIYTLRAAQVGSHLRIDVIASGFLRRQVRVLVGTALRALSRNDDHAALLRLAEAGDPSNTGPVAPPGGLVLADVRYAEPDDVGPALPSTRAPADAPYLDGSWALASTGDASSVSG